MKYPQHKQEIELLLAQEGPLTVKDFSDVLTEMPKGSVYARIRELSEDGRLSCIGKGKYVSVHKPEYQPLITPWMKDVANTLIESCEGVNHCVIHRGKSLEVQAYKGDLPLVYSALKSSYDKVAYKKDIAAVEDTLEGFIVLSPMITESPLLESEGVSVPSLEKELVDALCLGIQSPRNFQRYAEVYPINYSRLRRYAARRGVQEELSKILSTLKQERIEMFSKIQKYLEGTKVNRAWVFGSFARGEENENSDVDLLVDYDKSAGLSLLTIVRYQLDMEKLIGREVDLIESHSLKPFAVPSAERDKYLIYER